MDRTYTDNFKECRLAVLTDGNIVLRNESNRLTIWDPYNDFLKGSITERLIYSKPLIILSDGNLALITDNDEIKKLHIKSQ